MKTGILVNEIMNTNFPIVDSNMSASLCIKKFNGSLGIVVIKNGYFLGIIGYEELLRGLIKNGKEKNRNIAVEKIIPQKKNFSVVKSGKDAFYALRIIKNGIDFIIIKDKKNILGLITKRDALDIEEKFLENLSEEKKSLEKCENCLLREPLFFLNGKALCEECI